MDLKNLSAAELSKLKVAIEKEVNSRKKIQRNKALGEIRNIAAKYGLKLSEIVDAPVDQSRQRKPDLKKAVKSAKKKIAYRHPDNPKLTWGGGRGRKPRWVQDWEAAGRSLDEIKVA